MKRSSLSLAIGAALLAAAPASAATITYGAPQLIAEADVLNSGVLYAVSFSNTAGADLTANGTTFNAVATGGNANVAASGFGSSPPDFNTTGSGAADAANVTRNAFSAGFQDVLGGGLNVGASVSTGAITLNNLDPGTDYLVQIFVSRSDPNDRLLTFDSANSVTLDSSFPGTADINDAVGQYTIGAFTADATSQSLGTITGGGPGQAFAFLSGLVVAEVAIPEPSTFAMLALAGAVAAVRRRV